MVPRGIIDGVVTATEDILTSLGWRPFFAAQLEDGSGAGAPARVTAVHRRRAEVLGDGIETAVPLTGKAAAMEITVGDWVVVDTAAGTVLRRLDRFGAFRRRAPGTGRGIQLISANVDTLFVMTSADGDFNPARLERYLAIANEAGARPVVVVTKADTVTTPDPFVADASRLMPNLVVEALDARDAAQVERLRAWCETGQTVALLGSSGVGKSTLINTLTGAGQATRAVRADDRRGRHTTTNRTMHRLPDGGWLIDTPGMRELQLLDVGHALDDVFAEITRLAAGCRYSDCTHSAEPGCAVLAAVGDGTLDAERLRRFRKLQAEDRRNTETVAERRARDRRTGKLYKSILADKHREKGEP